MSGDKCWWVEHRATRMVGGGAEGLWMNPRMLVTAVRIKPHSSVGSTGQG